MGSGARASPEQKAALYDEFLAVRASDLRTFTTPGHKRRPGLADDFLQHDVPLATGIEDRLFSRQLLETAERQAARAWGGAHARFGVAGSTHGNQALMLATTRPNSPVAVPRNMHKSLLSGLVLSGATPIWLQPDIEPETGLPLQIPHSEVSRALRDGATAVFLVEPTYFGVLADLERVRDTLKPDVPLLVDQAWGSHLGFNPLTPKGAIARGADATVISLHKTLVAFTQASITLISERIDRHQLDRAFDSLATTSPSAAILASIDRTRSLIETNGSELIGRLCANAEQLRKLVNAISGLQTFDSLTRTKTSFDPTKVVIITRGAGVLGFDLEDDLWAQGVRVEMSERDLIVPLLTIADTPEDVEWFAAQLALAVARCANARERPRKSPQAWIFKAEMAMSPREAFFTASESVRARASVGRVAWETIVPYPPGIPIVVPGEVITAEMIDGMREAHASGARLAYCADTTGETVRVVVTP